MNEQHTPGTGRYDDQTRNVQLIMSKGFRIIGGRVPAEIRKELRAAVKSGVLGHIKKDGLLPEVFFHNIHPHCYTAVEARKREAVDAVRAIAGVMVSPKQYRAGIEAMGGDVEEHLIARVKSSETAAIARALPQGAP